MRRNLRLQPSIKTQHGFSMLEVLITLVIVATALLGTAGLQLYAMRVNQSGQFRTQAVFLSEDIAERMETNKAGAVAGNYVVVAANAPSVATIDCTLNACDIATQSDWDKSQWETAIATLLPQASWSISRLTAGNPSTYEIVISWTDRSSNKTSHAETFSYKATRTISTLTP